MAAVAVYSGLKVGKHSGSVLLCLLTACSVRLHERRGQRLVRQARAGRVAYAASRVVWRKVALHVSHWMLMAFWLVLSCDLAAPLPSLALRSRFWAALAPCSRRGQLSRPLRLLPLVGQRTYVASAHDDCVGTVAVARGWMRVQNGQREPGNLVSTSAGSVVLSGCSGHCRWLLPRMVEPSSQAAAAGTGGRFRAPV